MKAKKRKRLERRLGKISRQIGRLFRKGKADTLRGYIKLTKLRSRSSRIWKKFSSL
jgi:hypothetical protein